MDFLARAEPGPLPTAALNTWIELSEGAYRANLEAVRRRVGPGVELAAVVKANAYGHGWREIAELAARHGADSFAVHSLDEALALRGAGHRRDILVMGHVPLARLEEGLAADLRLALYNLESGRALAALAADAGRTARIHLKVETGTHRQGVAAEDLPAFLELLRTSPQLRLDGIYTHFANIEDTTEHAYAELQLQRFEQALREVSAAGLPADPAHAQAPRRHAACSAAILLFPETYFDMVRLGISQYGLWPSRETLLSYQEGPGGVAGALPLQPVLTWKARVSQVKWVPADAYIGYGCTFQPTRATRLAILPVGYADGYDRGLSNQAWVLIHGQRAPVRGRVCMNLTMVDVTDIPQVAVEDEVVLIGRQGSQEIKAGQLAALIGSIHYEVVSRLSPAIERRIVT